MLPLINSYVGQDYQTKHEMRPHGNCLVDFFLILNSIRMIWFQGYNLSFDMTDPCSKHCSKTPGLQL